MTARLVVAPAVTFETIEQQLEALGWTRQPSTAVAPPLVAGEPEFASWKRRDQRASYSFNPVVRLRALGFSGEAAGTALSEAARRLPALDVAGIRALLAGPAVPDLLLGIFAARELGAVLALDLVVALRDHGDARVAGAAERAATELTNQLLKEGSARLVAEQARRPGHSAIFPRLGDAHQRRQVLRWLLADHLQLDEQMLSVLRAALEDADWEVRAGAMIAAARLNARDLWSDVRRVTLPETTRAGPDRSDQSILRATRRLVLDWLQHGKVHAESEAHEQLRRCVLGDVPMAHDRIFLLVHALTIPHDAGRSPERLPAGVVAHQDGHALVHGNLPLCWIDAVPHWLGSGDPGDTPVRHVTPARGFFVSLDPHPSPMTWDDAAAHVADVARTAGVAVRLPAADEWELAARGSDGRRFPWGNGYEGDPRLLESPWGVREMAAIDGDWATEGGDLVACGDRRDLRAAVRRVTSASEVLRVRLAISGE